jgi:hypothetical protein
LAALLATAVAAPAQPRPYLGFVYPAGGQQGTTVPIRLGGQNLDGVNEAMVSGLGVSAKVVEYCRRLNNQETALLKEQLAELKKPAAAHDEAKRKLAERIERRLAEFVATPAAASLSSVVLVEVTLARDAKPGRRELVLATPRGVSNPLAFYVGQLAEVSRKPMLSATLQVLGKEETALRKRPEDEVEQRISLPCIVNGQIASGEINRYRFQAHRGQRLVIAAQARELIPFIADAVPGWFQPVMALYDAAGKEVAYSDGYRFKPDPVILYEVPKDGEYACTITDAIYRGREDFVYRVTLGELPFVTSIFPLGSRAGEAVKIEMKGWNLRGAKLTPPAADAAPGLHPVAACREGFVANVLPFVLDTLPECFEKEPNDDPAHAQKVKLPIIINGRIDRPDDWDVFQFTGRGGATIVAEVTARRLDSPLDSQLRLTDAAGKLLAMNDDHEDLGSGINTHQADSYLTAKLPADGTYYVSLGDTARHGGEAYGYRLRLSAPRPDFALYAVPSSIALRGKSSGPITVHAIRKDGFDGPIKLGLKDPPAGFSSFPVALPPEQTTTWLTVKTNLRDTKQPVRLVVEGRARIAGREVVHEAVAAEDRMQAFLWRHLVPAEEMKALVFTPPVEPLPTGVSRTPAPPSVEPKTKAASTATGKPKFTPQQIAGRVREIKRLFEEGLITADFNNRKVAECEALR